MYIVISNINKPFGKMFVLIQKHPKNSYTTLNGGNHQQKNKYNQYIKFIFNKNTYKNLYMLPCYDGKNARHLPSCPTSS
jgi:hypothetical protein